MPELCPWWGKIVQTRYTSTCNKNNRKNSLSQLETIQGDMDWWRVCIRQHTSTIGSTLGLESSVYYSEIRPNKQNLKVLASYNYHSFSILSLLIRMWKCVGLCLSTSRARHMARVRKNKFKTWYRIWTASPFLSRQVRVLDCKMHRSNGRWAKIKRMMLSC